MKKTKIAAIIALIIGIAALIFVLRSLITRLLAGGKEEAFPEEDIFQEPDPDSRLVEFPAEPEAKEEKSQDRARRGYIRLKFHDRMPEAL